MDGFIELVITTIISLISALKGKFEYDLKCFMKCTKRVPVSR